MVMLLAQLSKKKKKDNVLVLEKLKAVARRTGQWFHKLSTD
jgi:hypothetical protein